MIKRLLLLLCSAAVCFAQADSRRAMKPEDVYRLGAVSDPQVSPDGQTVAYVLTTIDTTKNRRVASIWTVPADGSRDPQAFVDDIPARSPRWSADGKWLAFISNAAPESSKSGLQAVKNQVWLVARDGSSRRIVTHFENGISRFSWSPDGTQFAVVARLPSKSRDVRHYSSIFYKRDGSGWMDENHDHVWIVDVSNGTARQLTSGTDREDSEPQWSPNGKWIAYVSTEIGPDLRNVAETDSIMVMPATGGEARTILGRHFGVSAPRWAPDSRQLAFGAAPTADQQPVLWIASLSEAKPPSLASDADLFPTEIEWSANGLWFGARARGDWSLYRVDVATHHATRITVSDRSFRDLRVSDAARRLVYLADDPQHPNELFSSDLDGKRECRITFHNRELLNELKLGSTERLTWKSADGLTIEGFLLRPADWQAGHKYPMVLNVHGGPNGMFGFYWRVDAQLYASNGYAVLMTNPRGSSGYGMKFQRAVAGEWGGKAYQDIQSGVEAALARFGWIDPERLGVVGHSFGGFMTNWTVTQTNRFKAAISISGIADFISVQGTRDAAFGHTRDFGGDLFTAFETYWKYSPIRLASRVKTPLLFLHGEEDHRVPLGQAEEYFRAIKHFGGVTELVIFPRESHMLPLTSEPKHLVETYRWRLYWFDRFVRGIAAASPAETP